jgi:hypothetical protein
MRGRHEGQLGGGLADSFGLEPPTDRPARDRDRGWSPQPRRERDRSGSPQYIRGGDRRRGDDERPVREKPTGSRVRPEDIDHTWPDIPEWVDVRALGPDVRADLRGLSNPG